MDFTLTVRVTAFRPLSDDQLAFLNDNEFSLSFIPSNDRLAATARWNPAHDWDKWDRFMRFIEALGPAVPQAGFRVTDSQGAELLLTEPVEPLPPHLVGVPPGAAPAVAAVFSQRGSDADRAMSEARRLLREDPSHVEHVVAGCLGSTGKALERGIDVLRGADRTVDSFGLALARALTSAASTRQQRRSGREVLERCIDQDTPWVGQAVALFEEGQPELAHAAREQGYRHGLFSETEAKGVLIRLLAGQASAAVACSWLADLDVYEDPDDWPIWLALLGEPPRWSGPHHELPACAWWLNVYLHRSFARPMPPAASPWIWRVVEHPAAGPEVLLWMTPSADDERRLEGLLTHVSPWVRACAAAALDPDNERPGRLAQAMALLEGRVDPKARGWLQRMLRSRSRRDGPPEPATAPGLPARDRLVPLLADPVGFAASLVEVAVDGDPFLADAHLLWRARNLHEMVLARVGMTPCFPDRLPEPKAYMTMRDFFGQVERGVGQVARDDSALPVVLRGLPKRPRSTGYKALAEEMVPHQALLSGAERAELRLLWRSLAERTV